MATMWEEARRRAAKRVGKKRIEEHAEEGEQYVKDVKEGGKYYQEYKRPSLRNLAKAGPVITGPEYSRTFQAQVGASPELVRKIFARLQKKKKAQEKRQEPQTTNKEFVEQAEKDRQERIAAFESGEAYETS